MVRWSRSCAPHSGRPGPTCSRSRCFSGCAFGGARSAWFRRVLRHPKSGLTLSPWGFACDARKAAHVGLRKPARVRIYRAAAWLRFTRSTLRAARTRGARGHALNRANRDRHLLARGQRRHQARAPRPREGSGGGSTLRARLARGTSKSFVPSRLKYASRAWGLGSVWPILTFTHLWEQATHVCYTTPSPRSSVRL
jgi:hypothetical protein